MFEFLRSLNFVLIRLLVLSVLCMCLLEDEVASAIGAHQQDL